MEDMTRSFETDIMLDCTDKVGAVPLPNIYNNSHDNTNTLVPGQNINDAVRAMRLDMFGESGYKGGGNYTVSSYLYTMVGGMWRYGLIVFSTD